MDKRLEKVNPSRSAPARLVKVPYLKGGELKIPHRAFPDIRFYVTVKHRMSDMPIRNPDNPLQVTDQMGLCHFAPGYQCAREEPRIRSWQAKRE